MLTGLGHVAIRCRDLDVSLAFYRTLGLREAFRLPWPDGTGVRLIMLRVGAEGGLELITGGSGTVAQDEHATGLMHVCLLVDDIHAAYQRVQDAGIPITSPLRTSRDKTLQFWITDPDGVVIEVMQLLPESLLNQAE